MPNYFNDLISGVNKGLTGIAGGMLEHSQRQSASDLFEQGKTYLQQMGLQNQEAIKNMNIIANPDTGSRPTTTSGMRSSPEEKPIQQKQGKEVGLGDIYRVMGDLANNPYGTGYAKSLEDLYKLQVKAPEYKIVGDQMYEYKNGKWSSVIDNRKESEDIKTSEESYFKEDLPDGTIAYYKQYPVIGKDKEGNVSVKRYEKVPVTEKEYINKSQTYQEKSDIMLNRGKEMATFRIDLGGTKKKGRGGKEILSTLDAQTSTDALKYVQDSLDYDKMNPESRQAKDLMKKLKSQRELLKSRMSESDINDLLAEHREGKLTKKELTKTVRNSSPNTIYNLKWTDGKTYKGDADTLAKQIVRLTESGIISVADLKDRLENAKTMIPSELYNKILSYLK